MPRSWPFPGDAGQRSSNPGSLCVWVEGIPYCIVQLYFVEAECCEVLSPARGPGSLIWAGNSVPEPRTFVMYPVHHRAHSPLYVIYHLSSEKDPV